MQVTEIQLVSSPDYHYLTVTKIHKIGEKLIISTKQGMKMGIVTDDNKKIDRLDDESVATVIRVATTQDEKQNCENCKYTRSLLPQIKQDAKKLKLNMKIGFISVDHERTKIIVNYTADERVDFRELIKVLGSKFKSRIEMRQIGNRDETKQIGAMGICGRETCCKSFLSDFDKVSIKMAKNQNIALNPTRINGMCGRLLCCLKYEDDFYTDIQTKMPKTGWRVSTPDGEGIVSYVDFLKEQVSVTFTKDESVEMKTYNIDSIKFTTMKTSEKKFK